MINNNNSQPRPQHNYCTASYLIFVYSILNIFNKEFLLTDLDRLFLEEPELEKDSSDLYFLHGLFFVFCFLLKIKF